MTAIGTDTIEGFTPADETAWSARAWLRVGLAVALLALLAGISLVASDYWLNAVLIPFLIMSLTALGLNLLMGYAGQASLGSGGFMLVGAYATYNLLLRLPELPLPVSGSVNCSWIVPKISVRIRRLTTSEPPSR